MPSLDQYSLFKTGRRVNFGFRCSSIGLGLSPQRRLLFDAIASAFRQQSRVSRMLASLPGGSMCAILFNSTRLIKYVTVGAATLCKDALNTCLKMRTLCTFRRKKQAAPETVLI